MPIHFPFLPALDLSFFIWKMPEKYERPKFRNHLVNIKKFVQLQEL